LPDTVRYSHQVGEYPLAHGYCIIPVNPTADKALGLKAIPPEFLASNNRSSGCFPGAEKVLPIADEAIAVDGRAIWFQEGVINEAAVAKARQRDCW